MIAKTGNELVNPSIRYVLVMGYILAACSPAASPVAPDPGVTPLPPSLPPLTVASTSTEIQEAMLTSALRWQTIFLDGSAISYDISGQPASVLREQDWIDLANARFRVLVSTPNSEAVETYKVCDGITIFELHNLTAQSQTYALPHFARVGAYVPPLEAGVAHPQPLWGQIGTELSGLAFPSDRAQNQGSFRATGAEQVAGRETVVVEWTYIENSEPSFRAWLDAETAVILRLQEFDKSGGGPLRVEKIVNVVRYNQPLDPALFAPPTGLLQFGNEGAGPTALAATDSAPAPVPVSLGELYFFLLPHQQGKAVELVRLPGACVAGDAGCLPLESIPAPFPFNFNLSALAWSRDGKFAAFAYPDNASGTPYKLWLIDPAAKSWKSLADFPFIDPPFWSPDGTWIAFRTQDGVGGESVYVVHRDGTNLRNVSAGGSLPAEARPYVMDGWLTENLIMRSALPGKEGTVYLVRAGDGQARPLFDTLLTKAILVPSPNGAWLAYDDYDYAGQKHALRFIEPDGAHPLDLAAFAGGSLYPIVWSPSSEHLAFAHTAFDAGGNPTAAVYVIRRDGTGLTQVYQGLTVGRIVFSPDGRFLLVEETTSISGGHLFAVNLETLQARLLQAPGLTLDSDWYAPSWRP